MELRTVTRSFGGGPFSRRRVDALRDFSLSVEQGQPTVTAVVGESGSGKTTMARLLLGLDRPTSGTVQYLGAPLPKLSRTQRHAFRRDVQAIFQDPFAAYNTFYPVDHALAVPLAKFGLAHSPSEARALMEQALRSVGLRPEATLGRYPHELSGGQRQRTMVARALLLRPRLIVADEPVSMIDASLRLTVLANLMQLKRDFGISLVYITHDLTTAYQISDRIVVLYHGSVVEAGDPEEIVRRPRHAYTQLLIQSIPEPDPARPWEDLDLEVAHDGIAS
jgi:peptide/nickel transport system ATP-binding protein